MDRFAKKLWNLKAYFHDKGRSLFPFRCILEQENEHAKKLLQGVSVEGKWVVDIGTGTGNALRLLPEGAKLVGLDHSKKMLYQARRRFPRARFVVGDALALPFKPAVFDLVLVIGVFEYQMEREYFLDEIWRVVKETGKVLITFSPPTIFTLLRNLTGTRVYPSHIWGFRRICGSRFILKQWAHSPVQYQCVLEKKYL